MVLGLSKRLKQRIVNVKCLPQNWQLAKELLPDVIAYPSSPPGLLQRCSDRASQAKVHCGARIALMHYFHRMQQRKIHAAADTDAPWPALGLMLCNTCFGMACGRKLTALTQTTL